MQNHQIREVTHLVKLIQAYRSNTITNDELEELMVWINTDQKNKAFFMELTNPKEHIDSISQSANLERKQSTLQEILKLPQETPKKKSPFVSTYIHGAVFKYVAFFLFAFFIVGFYLYLRPLSQTNSSAQFSEISAGSNRAVLTLANGQTINLNEDKEGIIIDANEIKYKDGVPLLSTQVIQDPINQESLNSITTPRGGQYQVILPDGTKVWLNASSTLKYPSQFSSKNRTVELEGEAYFEVKSNKETSFIVKSATQKITVLGTKFNVSAYHDEPVVKTTLLEGSVSLSTINHNTDNKKEIYLKPNEQSTLFSLHPDFQLSAVDASHEVAWKNGDFIFKNETLASIMRKLSRWYDVDIIYPDAHNLDRIYFSGMISRSKNLSTVLEILETAEQIKFKITGKEVQIMM